MMEHADISPESNHITRNRTPLDSMVSVRTDHDVTSLRPAEADCVGIVTRTKNRPILLERSIRSVLSQTYGNWVHIIVNDGGDRNALETILSKYASRYQGKLTLIDNPEAIGAVPSLNVGLRACQSDYAVTHDDDDSWEPEFLAKSIRALKLRKKIIPNSRGIMCHTTAVVERADSTSVTERYRFSWNGWVRAVALVQLAATNFIPPISFVYEKEVLSEIGFFKDLKFADDWEFYLRFLSKFDIAVLPEHLANWHLRPESKDSYGNTVEVDRERDHAAIVAALRNDLIRQDLASGKLGLGFLVALSSRGPQTGSIRHQIWGARQRILARWQPRVLIRRLLGS
jgi:glycosyltransferase involved in cell wall biosynthesis